MVERLQCACLGEEGEGGMEYTAELSCCSINNNENTARFALMRSLLSHQLLDIIHVPYMYKILHYNMVQCCIT